MTRVGKRGSVLAAELSGNAGLLQGPEVMDFIVDDDSHQLKKGQDYRRLSTLYGVSALSVQKTKLRSGKKKVGNDSSKSRSAVHRQQQRTVQQQQDDMKETFQRMIKMQRNKRQNLSEPLIERLSRPKSAVSKFTTTKKIDEDRNQIPPERRPKPTPEQREREIRREVHADNVASPWFFGNNNACSTSSSPFSVASRFGFRGALNMTKQCSQRAQHFPLKLIDNPQDINIERDLAQPNEWGPTLHNRPASTGFNHNTPKMWPEAAEFPTGVAFKRENRKVWYNRESTLGHRRPKSALPERLSRTLQREKAELIEMHNTVNQERKALTLTRPRTAPTQRTTRKKIYNSETEEKEVNQVIETNRLQYFGEMSASVKRDIRPEYARTIIKKQNDKMILQADVKWMLLSEFFASFRRHRQENRPNGLKGPGLSDLHDLASLFQLTSQDNPNPNVLSREQFVASVTKTALDASYDERMAQKLYTTFDGKSSNRIAWVLIVASIRALHFENEPPAKKIIGIFEVFEKYTPGKLTAKNCNVVFTIVSGSEEEKHAMNVCYRHNFVNYLLDAIRRRNKNSTLDLTTDTVEFAKVNRENFAEAINRSAGNEKGIVKLFGRQCRMTKRRSGAIPSDREDWNNEMNHTAEVRETIMR